MEGSGGGSSGRYDDEPPRRGALSPIRAGAVVLAMLLIAGSIFFLASRSGSGPAAPLAQQTIPTIEPSVNEPLTESEAIAILRDLIATSVSAIRDWDRDLAAEVFEEGSPALTRAEEAIRNLKRDEVRDLSTLVISGGRLVSQSLKTVRVVAESALTPCFRDENGRDVSRGPRRLLRTSEWVLVRSDFGWLIRNATIRKERVIGKNSAKC